VSDNAEPVIGVVCEAADDCEVVAILARRISASELTTCGADEGTTFLTWVRASKYSADGFKYVPLMHGDVEPTAFEGYRALRVFEDLDARPTAVVMLRDVMKGRVQTRKGLEQARTRRSWPFDIAIGVADPEIEAWILSGFSARTKKEKAALKALKKEWKLDPTTKPHRLGVKHDPKVALDRLTDGDADRGWECLQTTPFADLEHRGDGAGLKVFVAELRRVLQAPR
jgi:hypothetical protein